MAINYTDSLHPIIISEHFGKHISEEYFKEHEKEIKEAYMHSYNRPGNDFFEVPSFMFSQELLDMLLTKTGSTINLHDVVLSPKQLKQLNGHFVEVKIDEKVIHDGNVIYNINYNRAQEKDVFFLPVTDIKNWHYPNFIHFKDANMLLGINITFSGLDSAKIIFNS